MIIEMKTSSQSAVWEHSLINVVIRINLEGPLHKKKTTRIEFEWVQLH